jgi:cystathionine beta-synthase
LLRKPATVDTWIKTGDEEAFAAVKMIMRNEALLVGGSSGSALSGAFKWFKTEEGKKITSSEGKNVVVIFPDGCVLFFVLLSH